MLQIVSLFGLTALISLPAIAGDKVLNGGDACERRFLEVRNDLRSWIENGGADDLVLPASIKPADYRARMLSKINSAALSCGDDRLSLGSREKTCLNEIDAQGAARIRCQSEAYLKLSQDDQYRLTHHEYAGLAGMELNESEESHYELSNQIAAYLDTVQTKKLSVKNGEKSHELILRNFGDFFGAYQVLDCKLSVTEKDGSYGDGDFCEGLEGVFIGEGFDALKKSTAAMSFRKHNKKPQGDGMVLGWSSCQVSYGSSYCQPGFGKSTVYVSARLQKLGETTTLEYTVENVTPKRTYRNWLLVLKRP